MSESKKIKLDYGFFAYECDDFYKKLKDVTSYKPCSLAKNKIEAQIKEKIKFVVIDASLWNKMIAFWKQRLINLAYGFYDIKRDVIFINIKSCGISATKECHINTTPSPSILKNLSRIIAHEYIHYQFQKHTIKVLNKTKNELFTFYKTYWNGIVTDDILQKIYRAHFYIASNTNKNIIDPVYGKLSKLLLKRFINILELTQKHNPKKIIRKQTFADTLETIKSIYMGTYYSSELVTMKILRAYKKMVSDLPPRDIALGQELIYASEILSICANIQSSKSLNIVRKIISI